MIGGKCNQQSLIISTMNSNVIKLATSGPWRQLNSFSNNDLNLGYIYLPQYNAIEFGDGKYYILCFYQFQKTMD